VAQARPHGEPERSYGRRVRARGHDAPEHGEPVPDAPEHGEPVPDAPEHGEPVPDAPELGQAGAAGGGWGARRCAQAPAGAGLRAAAKTAKRSEQGRDKCSGLSRKITFNY